MEAFSLASVLTGICETRTPHQKAILSAVRFAWGKQKLFNRQAPEANRPLENRRPSPRPVRKGLQMQASRRQERITGSKDILHRPRILLVDEDSGDRDHYRRMLHDSGFEVRACSDFAEGAKLLGTIKFDCIVVSQGGPRFEGRMVLERSIARDRYRPVIVLSRYHDVGCYLEAMQLGAVDYLEKPLSAVEIVRAVTTHLPARQAAA